MKLLHNHSWLTNLFFALFSFFVVAVYCVDRDNYIHIDYIKKKYPEIEINSLKAQAISDEQTAPISIHVGPGILQFLSATVVTIFLFKNVDKIESWLQAISTKYPLNITLGNATQNGGNSVSFGVPYTFLIPYTGLIYWIAKR